MTYEEAKQILGDACQQDGHLYSLGWYLDWSGWENPDGKSYAILDGEFTADHLEAIAWWMKNVKVVK